MSKTNLANSHEDIKKSLKMQSIKHPCLYFLLAFILMLGITSLKTVTVYASRDDGTAYYYNNIYTPSTTPGFYWNNTCAEIYKVLDSDISSIKKVEINKCTNIEPGVFNKYPNINEIYFGNDNMLTSIDDNVFANCTSLTNVGLTVSGVTSIGKGAFSGCTNLENICLPINDLQTIGESAFEGCTKLTSIPSFQYIDTLKTIGAKAFYGCTALKGEPLEIPKNVTSIGSNAFWGCAGIQEVKFGGTIPPTFGEGALALAGDNSGSLSIIVPKDTVAAYTTSLTSTVMKNTTPSVTEPPVIKIGDKNYSNWSAAVKAVNDAGGGTMTLVQNITLGENDTMPTAACTIDGQGQCGLTLNKDTYLGADTTMKDLVLDHSGEMVFLYGRNNISHTGRSLTVEGTVTWKNIKFSGAPYESTLTVNGNLSCVSIQNLKQLTVNNTGTLTTSDSIYGIYGFALNGKATVKRIIEINKPPKEGFSQIYGISGMLSGRGTIVFTSLQLGNLNFRDGAGIATDADITLEASGDNYYPNKDNLLVRNITDTTAVANIDRLKLGTGYSNFVIKGGQNSTEYDYTLATAVDEVALVVDTSFVYGADITAAATLKDNGNNALNYNGKMEFFLDSDTTAFAAVTAPNSNGAYIARLTSKLKAGTHSITAKYTSSEITPVQNKETTGSFTVSKASGFDLLGTALTMKAASGEAAQTYTFDLSTIGLNKTDMGVVSYSVAKETDTDGIILGGLTVNNNILSIPVGENLTSGKAATVKITITTENYSDLTTTLTINTVDKTVLTVSDVSVSGKVYDGTAISPTGTPVFKNGETAAAIADPVYLYESTDSAGYSNAAPPKAAGAYKLTVSVPVGNADYKGKLEIPFTISQKPLEVTGITIDNKEYDGNITAAVKGTPTLSGVVTDDIVSLSGTPSFKFNDAAIGENKDMGMTGEYSLTGTHSGNYTLTQPSNLKANITKKNIIITPNSNLSKIYGEADPVIGYSNTQLVGTDKLTGNLAYTGTKAGKYQIEIGTLAIDNAANKDNYTISVADEKFESKPKPLTITGATVSDKNYDGTTSAGTAALTLDGIINGENVTAAGAATFETAEAGDKTKIDLSAITLDGTAKGNYTIAETASNIPATATVKKKEITVKADDKSIYIGGSIPENSALTYTVTGLIGSDTLKTVPVLTLDTKAVSTSAGTYTITVAGAAVGDNYNVTMENGTFNVTAAPYIPPYNPPTPQPTTETREIPVVVDNGGAQTNAVQVPVTRTTDSDGTKTDTVKFDEEKAKETVTKALETKTDTATISVTDIPGNNADKVEVQVPQSSMTQLGSNNIGLDVKTEKATLELPKETVIGLKGKDAKIQISEVKDSSEVEETKGLILKIASGSEVIAAPLKIETNFTGRTKITLPIDASKLPTSKEELDKFCSSLAVMVQHSDGENAIDKGTITYDEKGKPIGISIWVNKFSDFTLVSLPESYFEGRTTVIKDKVAADKEWNIKFTKIADSSTVTKDNVYVTDLEGNKIDVEVSYGSDNILKVTPVNPYKSGETYYLYISKNVKSKSKTSLVNELRYQFTIK